MNYSRQITRLLMLLNLTVDLFSGPTSSVLARGMEPDTPSALFAELQLIPNIETVGVAVSGINLPSVANLMYRQAGAADWQMGHPLMRIDDGRLIGSLFSLSPSTTYEVKAQDGSTVISGTVSTQAEEPSFTPKAILYVDDDAPFGGNGSATQPFKTIQEGVNHASPGTQVLVRDGIYFENVTFPASGTAGNWIQVKAEGSGAILDGSATFRGAIWKPFYGRKNLWYTDIGMPTDYLARDQKRYYLYDNLVGIIQSSGHNRISINEGWYMPPYSSRLYVRSIDNPANHTWQAARLNHGFDAIGRDWIWIEGFEIRFYGKQSGCGVCTVNASHVVIRRNRIHNVQRGVSVEWTGSENQGNDSRIEENEIFDPKTGDWPWNAVKGTSMESTGIVVRGHRGAIVKDNNIHHHFNGIYTGSSAALENSQLAFDVDIYDNQIHDIADDALEPEGACINHRFRNNKIDSSFVGVSLAPVTQGPTWVIRSLITNYTGRAIKWDRKTDGRVLIYHNTMWTTAIKPNAMDLISTASNAILRNNLSSNNAYAINEVPKGSRGNDWDYNNWYTTQLAGTPPFKWESVAYNTIPDLCKASRLECHSLELNPGLVNPAGGDFSLSPSSPIIDRGFWLPGINDGFSGIAPDLGAIELGTSSNPVVLASARQIQDIPAVDTVGFIVTFSEDVSGVDTTTPFSDFILTTTAGLTGSSIQSVTPISGKSFEVSILTGTGTGTIRLDIVDDDSIKDNEGFPLGGNGTGNGTFTSGEIHSIEQNPPIATRIIRMDTNPTTADVIRFSVSFSEPVRGVDQTDFKLTMSGNFINTGILSIETGASANLFTVSVNAGTGSGSIRLDLADDDSIMDQSGQPLGGPGAGNGSFVKGEAYTKTIRQLQSVTYRSNGGSDGWILENSEDGSAGGTLNLDAATLSIGDDQLDRQFRGLLSFPTGYLPDNAVILSAILSITRQGLAGTDPFTTHGNISVDIKSGGFSPGPVQAADFQASANMDNTGIILNNPVDGIYWVLLDPASYGFISRTSATQFRIQFELDDNDDRNADYIKFFSGDYEDRLAARPRLTIEYYVP
jgi:hypothetical protein